MPQTVTRYGGGIAAAHQAAKPNLTWLIALQAKLLVTRHF